MATSAIGIDIGSRTVTVAEVTSRRGATRVINFGGVELPLDVAREGEILDPASVAEALRGLLSTAKVSGKKVWLGVSNQRVVVRQIALPALPEKDLRASLRYQVQEYIPIPVEEAELDVHILDTFTADDGTEMQRLLLVAGHRDMISAHVDAARQAGVKPIGVDLNPFAVLRAVGDENSLEPGGQVLVDVGAGVTNMIVHDRGVPTFVRVMVMGGDQITDALAAGLSVTREEAEAAKRQARVGSSADPTSQLVTDQADALVDEIRSSLDYYQAQSGGTQLSGMVLTGGGALLDGLPQRVEAQVRLPVQLGNPFARWRAHGTVYTEEELAQVGPSLVTAIGLALGGLE
ncbi:MAG: type IV pilus assembly protein PilM [Nitriliruptoraceae bacterium]